MSTEACYIYSEYLLSTCKMHQLITKHARRHYFSGYGILINQAIIFDTVKN